MAEKPELSTTASLQNVVVYVSNDNFAQAYTTTTHHQHHHHHHQQQHHHAGDSTTYVAATSTMVAPQPDKCPNKNILKTDFRNNAPCFGNATTEIYQQPQIYDNLNYNHRNSTGDSRTEFRDNTNYVTVIGSTGPVGQVVDCTGPNPNSVRNCDSVRSETSCSSSSSGSSTNDEGIVMVQNAVNHHHQQQQLPHQPPDMVLYDNVSVRNGTGGVVLTVGHHHHHHHHHPTQTTPASASPLIGNQLSIIDNNNTFVSVPYGWKRISNNGNIVYISPSNAVLTCQEQIKEYLLSSGTCKCGLECHFKYDNVFNFDPKVASKPWTYIDTQIGDFTKLCNHKRKMLSNMASLEFDNKAQHQVEPNLKMIKDYNVKRKKRKVDGISYNNVDGGLPSPVLPQLHRNEKMQKGNFLKDNSNSQIWASTNQFPPGRLQNYTEMPVRYPVVEENRMVQQSNESMPNRFINANPNVLIHNHQVIGADGQIIDVQKGAPPYHGSQKFQSQRIYTNQPNEPSGPGRPILLPEHRNGPQNGNFYNNAYEQKNSIRPFYGNNGYRPTPVPPPPPPPQYQPRMWHRLPNPNVYERVPPLHPGVNPTVWQQHEDEVVKKKRGKKNRGGGFVLETTTGPASAYTNCQLPSSPQCPNIDVRQITNENVRQMSSHNMATSPAPSFMEDPSGYLAQQTALLNNTINRQTGANSVTTNQCGFLCQNGEILPNETNSGVPLPMSSMKHRKNPQQGQYVPDSSEKSIQCHGCVDNTTSMASSVPPVQQSYVLNQNKIAQYSRPNSQPGTPNSDDVTSSSNYQEIKSHNEDNRPIQGGTISTSDGLHSGPSTPNPRAQSTPTPGQVTPTSPYMVQRIAETSNGTNYVVVSSQNGQKLEYYQNNESQFKCVTTMASGRTFGSNTLTSVQAGRSNNTATVSMNPIPAISKSPLEMVQSVVSSIQVPQSANQKPNIPGHILVSSNGQLIMAANTNQMPPPPPPPKVVTSSSPIMIPTVATQQMLGQQTVLLPAPFVTLQPSGVTMTMDPNLSQLVATGNLISSLETESPEVQKKKSGSKKRKLTAPINPTPTPTPSNNCMLQIAQTQNQVAFQQPMQALTILPSKNGGPTQFLMNSPNGLLSSPQQVNLLQPVNLINGSATNFGNANFPTIQQFIVPNLSTNMVMNPDGTATLLQDTNAIGMQLQLQNVNGQNILTPVQNGGVFNTQTQNVIPGMVIRTPSGGKLMQTSGHQHSPNGGGAFLSQTGQFIVNPQFNGQLSPVVASQQHFRQNSDFQQVMVPAAVSAASNSTYVQQNTTIVQQQTTMVSNGQNGGGTNGTVQMKENGYRQSVSTQTASSTKNQITTNTFCQTSAGSDGSPPDTTTHSPLGGQSPPTVDTTTHSSDTPDDGLSPVPSNCFTETRHQSMPIQAMVHCVSSSEPDSATQHPDSECYRNGAGGQTMLKQAQQQHHDFNDISSGQLHYYNRKTATMPQTHFAYAESSTMVHFMGGGGGANSSGNLIKSDDALVSSRHSDKRKNDTLLIMERGQHYEEEDKTEIEKNGKNNRNFIIGDLIWGPTKTCPAWPGKIVALNDDDKAATVKWFGNEKSTTIIDQNKLQTLSEGLEAHHSARKKLRTTSRKLNTQLENAIQEAMRELDKFTETNNNNLISSTKSCRLRSQK